MDRRDFLKGISLAFAATAIPISVVQSKEIVSRGIVRKSSFDPNASYGNALKLTIPAREDKELFKTYKEMLLEDARITLPRGTHFYILEGPQHRSDPYFCLFWLYTPKKLSEEQKSLLICNAVA